MVKYWSKSFLVTGWIIFCYSSGLFWSGVSVQRSWDWRWWRFQRHSFFLLFAEEEGKRASPSISALVDLGDSFTLSMEISTDQNSSTLNWEGITVPVDVIPRTWLQRHDCERSAAMFGIFISTRIYYYYFKILQLKPSQGGHTSILKSESKNGKILTGPGLEPRDYSAFQVSRSIWREFRIRV